MAKEVVSSPQRELSFDPPEKPGSQEILKEPSSGSHQDEAAQAVKPAEHTYIKLTPYKPTSRDREFRRRVKQERGYQCEQCRRTTVPENLNVHHILETRVYPQFARERQNVLVLCERCHACCSQGESFGASMRAHFYARLPSKIRERHLAFIERQLGPSSALACAFKCGNADHWNSKTVDDLTR